MHKDMQGASPQYVQIYDNIYICMCQVGEWSMAKPIPCQSSRRDTTRCFYVLGYSVMMLEIMVQCWNEKEVPANWTKFYMTILEKKGDLTLPSNLQRHFHFGNVVESVCDDIEGAPTKPVRGSCSRI